MFWTKKNKFTDSAIAYLKRSEKGGDGARIELPAAATPVVRRYSEDLCICYVVDSGKTYEYVQLSHLELEGIDGDELHRIGLRNLKMLVAKRQAKVQPYQNIFAFLMRGDFEASVILLDELWDGDFRQFVTGEYAIAIPARDILAFCDSSSEQGICELQQLIARLGPKCDHPISDKIYLRQNGRFLPRAP